MLTEQDQLTPQTQPNPIAVLVLSTVTQVFQTFNPPWPQFENMMVVIFPGLCVNHTQHHLLILFYQMLTLKDQSFTETELNPIAMLVISTVTRTLPPLSPLNPPAQVCCNNCRHFSWAVC